MSATALMLTAINATHADLGPETADVANNAGDLFAIPQVRPTPEPTVQTTVRLTDAQIEAIDSLVERFDTNRSALFTSAIRIYLDIR